MKRLPALLALVVVLVSVLMLATAGMASVVTLTFDEDFNSTDPVPIYSPPDGFPIASVSWMAWDGTDASAGHLWCTNFTQDSVISFTNSPYVHSFRLNGMPWTVNSGGIEIHPSDCTFGPLEIVALDSNGNEVWSTTVTDLIDYVDLTAESSWLTVDVNTAGVSSIIFRAPNPGLDPNGYAFYASIDNLVITEVPIPASVWLMVSGLAGLVGLRRKFTC